MNTAKYTIEIGGKPLPKVGEIITAMTYRSAKVGCGYERDGKVTLKVVDVEKLRPIPGIGCRFADVFGVEVAP
jgi:hypothetical protein